MTKFDVAKARDKLSRITEPFGWRSYLHEACDRIEELEAELARMTDERGQAVLDLELATKENNRLREGLKGREIELVAELMDERDKLKTELARIIAGGAE